MKMETSTFLKTRLAALATLSLPLFFFLFHNAKRFFFATKKLDFSENGDPVKSDGDPIKYSPLPLYSRPSKSVTLIDSGVEWNSFAASNLTEIRATGVVGFDCEWRSSSPSRVALLQIATAGDSCALLRLLRWRLPFPDSLVALLGDVRVLKVGVATGDDARRLREDHGLQVRGVVDLRPLALRCRDFEGLENLGLQSLAAAVLGEALDKRLRVSDWEAEELSPDQMEYAANDALVAVHLFREIIRRKSRNIDSDLSLKCDRVDSQFWTRAASMCQGLIDAPFQKSSSKTSSSSKPRTPTLVPKKIKAYVQRSRPLYENCLLLAPDGEVLSTVNASKATWYVDRGLGDIVDGEGDQLKVRLRFEPAGRPFADGIYYTQEKDNRCVVCGSEHGFNLRKNIVPQEYRKHFPPHMKDHSSHDVLLMCLSCHQEANLSDQRMRLELARMCGAPMGTAADVRSFEDADLKKVKSFGKALLLKGDSIPFDRRREMTSFLSRYYEVADEEVDEALLVRACNMETKTPNEDFKPHGLKVIEWMISHYEGQLYIFEKMWRQHFLDSMNPRFLPHLWSVDHNHENVRTRVERGDVKFLKSRIDTNFDQIFVGEVSH